MQLFFKFDRDFNNDISICKFKGFIQRSEIYIDYSFRDIWIIFQIKVWDRGMKIGINQIKYLTKFCTPHQIKSNQILEKRFEHQIKGQRKENRHYLMHSKVNFEASPTPSWDWKLRSFTHYLVMHGRDSCCDGVTLPCLVLCSCSCAMQGRGFIAMHLIVIQPSQWVTISQSPPGSNRNIRLGSDKNICLIIFVLDQ